MKYYIIAGEASGDLHGAKLIAALKEKDNKAQIRFWGGDLMKQAGGKLVKHYKELAFMGFWEVITHLGTILKNIKFCKKDWKMCVDNAMLINNYAGMSKVKAACKIEANSRAKFGSPEWSWVTFGTYYVGNRYINSGLVEVVDNTVKFQNGFGAMKKSKVNCVYDLKNNRN